MTNKIKTKQTKEETNTFANIVPREHLAHQATVYSIHIHKFISICGVRQQHILFYANIIYY